MNLTRWALLLVGLAFLAGCGKPASSGALYAAPAPQPVVGGIEYRGEVLACGYKMGTRPSGRTSTPLLDCDFAGFYDKYPTLLTQRMFTDFGERGTAPATTWINVGDTPLFCVVQARFNVEDRRNGQVSGGAACDWPRWWASKELGDKPGLAGLASPKMTGFPYRGKVLACTVDTYETNEGWADDDSTFTCDYEGFYRTNPELLQRRDTNDETVAEKRAFARWIQMGDEPLYCLRQFKYEGFTQYGAACDWHRWHAGLKSTEKAELR